MTVFDELLTRISGVLGDAELARLSPGLTATMTIGVGDSSFALVFEGGHAKTAQSADADFRIEASEDAWSKVLQEVPPPTYHAFTAWQLANSEFKIYGDLEGLARARAALERVFELVVAAPRKIAGRADRYISQITGSYRNITVNGVEYEIYSEEAGKGVPVLFLHTAGADSRQFHGQLADVGLAEKYRLVAVDLPFHGRSMPPRSWDGAPYKLTAAIYRDWCSAIINQIVGVPTIVAGGSMGAAMSMVLAAERSELVRGIVAIEPPFQSKGRKNPYQNHVGVHGGLHNSSYVRGLMSPTSPEVDRRRASWIYSQGAPGIYPGDLTFYSEEFDGAIIAPRINATKTPVALLCGNYDYSATPADGRKLEQLIPGSLFIEMEGLGHFPMVEHPDLFRPYLERALAFVASGGN